MNQLITIAPTPGELAASHPLTSEATALVQSTRLAVIDIMQSRDQRLIAIVGPCAQDDSLQPDGTPSVVKFAEILADIAKIETVRRNLLVIMRCPPAKPRSGLGTRGLEQHDLPRAHELLANISNLGVPLAIEVMNDKHIARYGDMISLAWIGARTQDTMLRHTLSAFPELPIFTKNGETGSLSPALASIKTIAASHANPEIITPDGRIAHIRLSPGNPNTGIIWRGGSDFTGPEGFATGLTVTAAAGQPYAVDCAHGNEKAHDPAGEKSVEGQIACFEHLLGIMKSKSLERQPSAIMIESNLLAGSDPTGNTPGMSVMDPCVSINHLREMLLRLAQV